MESDLILDDLGQKRNNFIKFLMIGGAIGILVGMFMFIMNYQSAIKDNPTAFIILLISLIIILVGLFLINKSRMDLI